MSKVINATLRTHRGDPYVPLPLQAQFHASPADIRAFIGAQNAGKTLACSVEILMEALIYPGAVCAVGRWALGQLKSSAWQTLKGVILNTCPQLVKHSTESANSLSFELINGSRIVGVHLQSAEALGSNEWSCFWAEECHEIDEEVFLHGMARCRPGPPGSYRVWLSGYPELGWLHNRFVKDARRYPDQALFQPRTVDNIHADPRLIERLRRSYSPEQVRILMEGSWQEVAGTIFDTFNPVIHCVPGFRVPKEWPRMRSLDPGYDHPAACLFATVDLDGNLIIMDEIREQGLVSEQMASKVLAKSGTDRFQWTVIDPSSQNQTHGARTSVFDAYQQAGVRPLRLAENDVNQSISRLRSLLLPDPARKFPMWHPKAGQKGSPRLFLLAEKTRGLQQELGNYRWQKHSAAIAAAGKARPVKEADDLIDCFVAGTLVATVSGEIPIERIQAGDRVWTRDGLRPVVAAWLTGERAIATALFSDGRQLVGTPTHPVWSVEDKAFIPLTDLSVGAIMATWNRPAKSSTAATVSGATLTPGTAITGSTTRGGCRAVFSSFTAWCTKTITALSRQVTRCITGTKTRSTTIRTTWSASPATSTASTDTEDRSSTPTANDSGTTSRPSDPRPRNGTALPTGSPGTRRTPAGCGSSETPFSGSVTSVVGSTPDPASAITPGSAPINAKPGTGSSPASITKSGSAPSAVSPSPATGTPRPAPAPVRVVRVTAAGTAPVYNLQVAGTPEYYANGILVHNCLRYLSLQRLGRADVAAKPALNSLWQQILGPPAGGPPALRKQLGFRK